MVPISSILSDILPTKSIYCR